GHLHCGRPAPASASYVTGNGCSATAVAALLRDPLPRPRREAMSGNTRTVTAPPVTIVDAMVVEIRPEEAAIWVTATMIGRPVAEYRPRAVRCRGVRSPEWVVEIVSRSTTGAPRTRAI